MNTPYPEHTPPTPPEGMRWEYRGMGWTGRCDIAFYGLHDWLGTIQISVPGQQPGGFETRHYFEAVPDPAHLIGCLKGDKPLDFEREPDRWSTEAPFTEEECLYVKNSEWTWMNIGDTDPVRTLNPLDPKGHAGSMKAPLCMLPSFPLHEASWVLKSGADKYGRWNWRENEVCASTYRSAMQRHLDQWFDGGEDVDEETSRSHLAHVIANACILMDAAKHGTLVDDRP